MSLIMKENGLLPIDLCFQSVGLSLKMLLFSSHRLAAFGWQYFGFHVWLTRIKFF